jgi:hypothetical protein
VQATNTQATGAQLPRPLADPPTRDADEESDMDRHDDKRREILRGIATAGCALAVPAMLGGCGGDEEPEGFEPRLPEQLRDDVGKASKERVEYQEQPNDGQVCAGCVQFNAEAQRCRIVAGPINPRGWCIAFVADQ